MHIGAEPEGVDAHVRESVCKQCGGWLDVWHGLNQCTETPVVKLVIGVIQVLSEKKFKSKIDRSIILMSCEFEYIWEYVIENWYHGML